MGVTRDAGVVADDVDGAEAVARRPCPRVDRARVGDVGRDCQHVDAAGRQVFGGVRKRRLLHVGEHQPHALGREPVGECPPDAAGTAGDHRHLAVEILHHVLLVPGSDSRNLGLL